MKHPIIPCYSGGAQSYRESDYHMHTTLQHFYLGDMHLAAERIATTPYFLSHAQAYMVASIGGVMTPYGAEHLPGRMGGVWMHPLRVLHGWEVQVAGQPLIAHTCQVYAHHIVQQYALETLTITVTTHLVPNHAAMHVQMTMTNSTDAVWQGEVTAVLALDWHGCWYGGQSDRRLQADIHGSEVYMQSTHAAESGWGVLHGHAGVTWQPHPLGVCAPLATTVMPGQTIAQTWVLLVSHRSMAHARQQLAHISAALPLPPPQAEVFTGPQLVSADAELSRAWQLALHNLHLLVADYPDLPPYMLAGIPEYPQLFGCDTTYSIPGMMAAGMAQTAKSALLALAQYAQRACGRVPHEVTTNGRVFHPGNAQETPQYVVACWDYVAWSGDLAFAEHVYPLCVEGMSHQHGVLTGSHWPYGDGMVERHGMGPFKLDSVAYIYDALGALAQLADALHRSDDVQHWRQCAQSLQERFEAAWWMPAEGLYADSLHRDGSPQLDGHWTAVTPVYTGLASPDRQRTVYERLRRDFVNQWGLVHTRQHEELVWTLPTGLLALAAFQQKDGAYGTTLLKQIATTADHGSLGLLKELIPEGLCFVQLWSAALLAQGIVAGLCGVRPLAHQHIVQLCPAVPASQGWIALQGLVIGDHLIDIEVSATALRVCHQRGPQDVCIQVPYALEQVVASHTGSVCPLGSAWQVAVGHTLEVQFGIAV